MHITSSDTRRREDSQKIVDLYEPYLLRVTPKGKPLNHREWHQGSVRVPSGAGIFFLKSLFLECRMPIDLGLVCFEECVSFVILFRLVWRAPTRHQPALK